MGWGISVQCFEGGAFSKFPRAIAWSVFGKHARPAAFGGWDLMFPDGSCGHLTLDESEEITGFGIDRPGGGAVFDAVYEVLRQTSSIMIVDEDGRCVVADRQMVQRLPDWLLKALPPPAVVGSGKALTEYLGKSAGTA